MESFIAGLALILVGLVSTFFGYRFFRILVPIFGAVFGFTVAWGWWGESAWLLALAVGVALAVILGALAYTIWSAYMGIAGAVFGLALGSLISTSLNLWTWLAVLLTIMLALAFGLLFLRFRNEMVIVATALAGASATARGVGEWFGVQGGFDAAKSANATGLVLLMAVIFVVLAVVGIWFQWGRYYRSKLQPVTGKDAGSKAAAAPAAATRAAAADVGVIGAPAVASAPAGAVAVAGVAGVAVAGAATAAEDEAEAAPAVVAASAAGEQEAVAGETDEAVELTGEAAAEAVEPVAEVADTTAEEAAEAAGVAADDATAPTEAVVEAGAVVQEAVAEAALGEELAAGAAVAGLAAALDNKAEEIAGAEEVAQPADELEVATGTGDDSIVESVIKEIEETFSVEDIGKFKEKLEYVEGIGATYAEKLGALGVNTVFDLLRRGATRRGRVELAELSGISSKLILRWINHADLYRIKGVGSEYADLLEAAGVDTVVELGKRNPANLLNAMLETNKVKSLVRKEPVASQVEDWVAQAKKLPRVVQY